MPLANGTLLMTCRLTNMKIIRMVTYHVVTCRRGAVRIDKRDRLVTVIRTPKVLTLRNFRVSDHPCRREHIVICVTLTRLVRQRTKDISSITRVQYANSRYLLSSTQRASMNLILTAKVTRGSIVKVQTFTICKRVIISGLNSQRPYSTMLWNRSNNCQLATRKVFQRLARR